MYASDFQAVLYRGKYATAKYKCQYPFFFYGCIIMLFSINDRPLDLNTLTTVGLQTRYRTGKDGSRDLKLSQNNLSCQGIARTATPDAPNPPKAGKPRISEKAESANNLVADEHFELFRNTVHGRLN
jgi:hypothetical protein